MEEKKRQSVQKKKLMKNLRKRDRSSISMDTEAMIQTLKDFGMLNKSAFENMIIQSIQLFKNQPNVVYTTSPVNIVGDIHGQFYDLLTIFGRHGYPPTQKFLFMGDYVDRGMFGIEVLTLLLSLKIKYPKNMILLRGNHESRIITSSHNFEKECKTKYSQETYNMVMDMFDCLPLCSVVDHRYYCVHAGISPDLNSFNHLQEINRFVEVPCEGIICDLLWSDPTDERYSDWRFNHLRSCSYFYTSDQAKDFLITNKMHMIIRGHEVQLEGFKYQDSTNKKMRPTLTIFSAPNYCDKYNNKGAIGKLTQGDIKILQFSNVQHPVVLPNYQTIIQWSMPFIASSATSILFNLLTKKMYRNNKLLKKSLDEIKKQTEAVEQMNVVKQILDQKVKDYETQTFQPDQDLNETMSDVIKFLIVKEKDLNQAHPLAKKIEQSRKSNHKKKLSAQIFGPKIENFVRIEQKNLN